ncbi:lysine-2,3-aminomutase-like protein [Xanthobacter sp. TB0136]|uniref:lysine-2,3-aminomutase-like protein n=1 Tax=Xanthobacter sp. TB0136 TaxID=3459177 RepID=UPI00403A61DB
MPRPITAPCAPRPAPVAGQSVQTTLRTPDELEKAGLIPAAHRPGCEAVGARYAIAVTPELTRLINRDDPADPIALQFVPQTAELETTPQERADPIGDDAFSPVPGIVHRYPDRVLLKIIGVCAVYCRFCFRREMVGPGSEHTLSAPALENALSYIRAHPEIWEVILTGGDPFMLSPRRMREIMAQLSAIPHVRVVRFHTRIPIAAPERVSAELITSLKASALTSYVAIHVNHARELAPTACAAIARLADAGVPLVSQTVLLRGVNNDAQILADLFRRLVECRVKPYYLHHPDLAPGTSHFRLSIQEGQALMQTLRGRISGLAIPTYILDIPGGAGKIPLTPNYLSEQENGFTVTDNCGGAHIYPPSS